ncbi:MAG: reprolysin-like metallopeptidase [Bacteroidota bacterium]
MRSLFTLALALISVSLVAQSSFLLRGAQAVLPLESEADLYISSYQGVVLDLASLREQISAAPLEFSNGRSAPLAIDLPTPEGVYETFKLVESPFFAPALQAQYPNIRSYRLTSEYGTGRMSVTDRGVVALLRGSEGSYFITQAVEGNSVDHLVYYLSEMDFNVALGPNSLRCDTPHLTEDNAAVVEEATAHVHGNQGGGRSATTEIGMYVYDLALTCTGEYAQAKGGTLAAVNATYNEAFAVVNAVYENDMAMRFQLVADNDTLIYLDPNLDPFPNATDATLVLQQVLNAFELGGVTPDLYDIGHVFTRGCEDSVGGRGALGSVCNANKHVGITCHASNNVAAIAVRIMNHEIGHQMDMNHTFNFCPSDFAQPDPDDPNDQGARRGPAAFEPGSGSTIMSYGGTCESQNIFGGNDNYFHAHSLLEGFIHSRISTNCATILTPENTEPKISLEYEDGFFIPHSTPFVLKGTATDAEDDPMTYTWEQYDLGPERAMGDPGLNCPLFRSYPPTADRHTRYFPRLSTTVNNITDVRDFLPTYARDLTFRFTVRDNNENVGAAVWEEVAFHVADTGPFLVMAPNTGNEDWEAGQIYTVEWDVAGTDLAPVNCERVNINLSLDGGFTYPIILANEVPNNGSIEVLIPADVTSNNQARIQVEAADNIFFDISNENFSISAPSQQGFALSVGPTFQQVCVPDAAVIDLGSTSVLGFDGDVSLEIVSELPEGVTASFDNPVFSPGENGQLMIDFSESFFGGELTLVIEGNADGIPTATRTVTLDVVNNDFSDLALMTPTEGQGAIILSTDFDWTDATHADAYDIQIATDPSFSPESIFETSEGIAASEYIQSTFFEPSQIYFWRVRPVNACGAGPWGETASFQTALTNCTPYENTDNVGLQGNGPPFVATSELFVDQMGTISDVNIPNINLNYQVVARISLTLISPSGTRVLLYGEDCPNFSGIFNSGFDDDAPVGITCPPDDGIVFVPNESLAAFEGEDTFGNWILEISISETGGSVGALNSWNIEFCSASSPSSPELITLETLECPPTGANSIGDEVLEAQDPLFGADELVFSFIRGPRAGYIHRVGNMTPLEAGDTFTQAEINNDQLVYRNTDGAASTDSWRFIVTNPDGGYIPVTEQPISIFEGATTGTPEIVAELGLELFPNPVADILEVRWTERLERTIPVVLYDVTGRELVRQRIRRGQQQTQLDMNDLPAGTYWLRIADEALSVIKQ